MIIFPTMKIEIIQNLISFLGGSTDELLETQCVLNININTTFLKLFFQEFSFHLFVPSPIILDSTFQTTSP